MSGGRSSTSSGNGCGFDGTTALDPDAAAARRLAFLTWLKDGLDMAMGASQQGINGVYE